MKHAGTRAKSITEQNVAFNTDLEGPRLTSFFEKYGLGEKYYDSMMKQKERLHQIDAQSGIAETCGAVLERASQVAVKLREKEITEDDVVVICSKSHSDQTVAVLSILLVGAVISPIDPELSHRDCFCLLQKLKPKLVFCDNRTFGQIERVLSELGRLHLCSFVLFNIEHTDRLAFEKLLCDPVDPLFEVTPVRNIKEKTAFILPTQGATGPIKLVCISHYSILFQTAITNKLLENVEKILSFFPLSWITQVLLLCASFSEPIVRVLPGNFTERNACKIIRDFRVDHAILGTEYAIKIANHDSSHDYDLSCLKCVIVGGYSTTALDISRLRSNLYPVDFIQVYGTTETGCVSGFLEQESDVTINKPASVGRILPGVKVRVVDIETREPLGPDTWGELLVKSEGLMLGYYRDVGTTSNSTEKGFFKTGDMAQYDKEGFLYIQCRVSDLIHIHGIRFSPLEIEDVIVSHPYVREAVVIGDGIDGKEIVACVVKKKDEELLAETLMTYISGRLPEIKCPNRIKFFEKLPKTTIGKIKKNELRNQVFKVTIKHSKSLLSIANSK